MGQNKDIAAVCTSCNMCCDGTLFAHVNFDQDSFAKMGADVPFTMDADGRMQMTQPCSKLGADGFCTCYVVRPAACDAYDCDLVKGIEAAQFDAAFAHDVVKQARQFQGTVIATCRKAVPPSAWPPETADSVEAVRALRQAQADGHQIDSARGAEALLHWTVYRTYIQKHFQKDFGTEEML